MANVDTPFGVRPVKHLNGAPWNGMAWRCYAATGYATAIYLGDPVVPAGSACTNGCCFDINVATVGDANPWIGGFVGLDPITTSNTIYRPASQERYCQVVIDPDVIYECQADTTLAVTQVFLNAVFIATHAGSTVTGLSGIEIDGTSDVPAADGSNQMVILGALDREDNDIATANAKWLIVNAISPLRNDTEGALGIS